MKVRGSVFSSKIVAWNMREVEDYLGELNIVALQKTWARKDREREWIKKLEKVIHYIWTATAAVRFKKREGEGRSDSGIKERNRSRRNRRMGMWPNN